MRRGRCAILNRRQGFCAPRAFAPTAQPDTLSDRLPGHGTCFPVFLGSIAERVPGAVPRSRWHDVIGPVTASDRYPVTERFDIVYCPLGATSFGGAERSILELASRFVARGLRIVLLQEPALQTPEFTRAAAELGVPLHPVAWTPRRGFLHNLGAMLHATREFDARLVHMNVCWLPWMWMFPLVLRLTSRAKRLATMRVMPDPHYLVPRKRYFGVVPGLGLWHLPELVNGWFWGRILDRTIAINARDFPTRLVRDFAYPRERLGVVYNGVRVRGGRIGDDERRALRARAGAGDADFLVCYAGRVSEEKGVHFLLEAIASLPPGFRLVVVGEGPQQEALRRQADALGIGARVVFTGFSEAPSQWMAASDVVAVPSTWYEAFGRVVVEAMNEGVPVVASRIGGMGELFDDGIEGIYVRPGRADDLGAAFRELADDPERRRRMGDAARACVRERYSLERVEADYAKEYAALAGIGRPSP